MPRTNEPLGRARRFFPTLYALLLLGGAALLVANGDAWLAAVLIGVHAAMIVTIVVVVRQPKDPWTGPRLRRPTR